MQACSSLEAFGQTPPEVTDWDLKGDRIYTRPLQRGTKTMAGDQWLSCQPFIIAPFTNEAAWGPENQGYLPGVTQLVRSWVWTKAHIPTFHPTTQSVFSQNTNLRCHWEAAFTLLPTCDLNSLVLKSFLLWPAHSCCVWSSRPAGGSRQRYYQGEHAPHASTLSALLWGSLFSWK